MNIDIEKLATYQLGLEAGMKLGMEMEIGRKIGAHKTSVAAATKLLEMELLDVPSIAKATGLSLSEVEDLAKRLAGLSNG